MDNILILMFIVVILISYTGGTCTFPATLQGTWKGGHDEETDKDVVFQFEAFTLKNFPLKTPNLEKSDFSCENKETIGDVTRFVLKSRETVKIFGVEFHLYFCLAVKDDTFVIETTKDKMLRDKLVVSTVGHVGFSEVCNGENTEPKTMKPAQTEF